MQYRQLETPSGVDVHDKLVWLFSGLFLVVLFVLSSFHEVGGYGVETDFYWAYAPDAERIANGVSPREPGVGPGYAFALIFVNFFASDWFTSGKILSILSTVFGGILISRTVKNLFDSKVGLYTLLVWSATVLPWAIVAGTDMFFLLVVSAALFFLFRNKAPSVLDLVASAAIMGYAILTRNNAVVLPVAAVIMLLLINPEDQRWSDKFKRATLFVTVCVAVVLPWALLKSFVFEDQIASDSYLVIASHFYGKTGVVSSEDMRLAAKQFDSLTSVVFYDFSHFVKHYLKNIYRHSYAFLLHSLKFPTFLFVVAGAAILLPRISKRQLAFFIFPVLSFLLLCLVHYEPRYYLYLVSFPISLAVYFLCQIARNFSSQDTESKTANYVGKALLAMTVLVLVVFSAKEIRANIQQEPRDLVEIAEHLRKTIESKAKIIARKPHLGFMANLETLYFPEATSLPELLEFAETQEADYLLYGDVEASRRPELEILLDPEQVAEYLQPIYIRDSPRTVVYRIRKQHELVERYN